MKRNRSIVQYIGEEDNEHCGYCGKNTSSLFGLWGHSLTPEDFLSLLNRGWRRYFNLFLFVFGLKHFA